MADGDLAFSTTSLGSRSSANSGISAGSRNRVVPWDTVSSGASAREPLLESARMTQPVSHLVSDDYGATQTSSLTDSGPDSRQASGMTQFAAEVYSTEVVRRSTSNTNVDNTRTPGILHGIQFLEADSTTVSGEYVNIKVVEKRTKIMVVGAGSVLAFMVMVVLLYASHFSTTPRKPIYKFIFYFMDDDGGHAVVNPTTLALQKCKEKVVKPYLKLLSLLGWFPIIPDDGTRARLLVKVVNICYPIGVVLLIVFGYIVQFAACFRRDGTTLVNNSEVVNCVNGHAISVYLIPDLLHSAAYAYAFYIFRWQQSENLITLMERVFLQSSFGQSGYLPQNQLITHLRGFLVFNILWVVMSLVAQIIHVIGIAITKGQGEASNHIISFSWIHVDNAPGQIILAIMMLIGFIALDIVYAAIVINYATHCELLIIMMRGMSSRVLQKTVSLRDVTKEIMTAQKFLKYTNETVATAVSILMFNFGTAVVIGIQSAVHQSFDDSLRTDGTLVAATIITVVLWATILLVPLVQAARLSTACWSLNKIGLEVAARPFGYQDTPQEELSAFLTFTTSLRLRAKLFRIPIRSAPLLLVLVTGAFTFMILLTVRPDLFHLSM